VETGGSVVLVDLLVHHSLISLAAPCGELRDRTRPRCKSWTYTLLSASYAMERPIGDTRGRTRLSSAQTRLNQKDVKSLTIQTAPVMRKVKPNSDQFRWASG
jgi:hypothetical protein